MPNIHDARNGNQRYRGATYRGMLFVIGQCIQFNNKRAAVLFSSDDTAKQGMRMAFEMITPLLPEGFAKFSHHRRMIEFENGSSIQFITARSLGDRLRGSRFQVGMIDNSLDSVDPKEAILAIAALRATVRD